MKCIFTAPAFIISNAVMSAYFREVESTGKMPRISDRLAERLRKISRWATKDHPNTAGLVLYSRDSQTGKTTLLRALYDAHETMRAAPMRGIETNYTSAEFLTAIDISMMAQHKGRAAIMEGEHSPAKTPLLFIDGLGCETEQVSCRRTDANGETITEVINPLAEVLRYRYLHGLPVILTTNLTKRQIGETYGKDVLSCVKEYKWSSYCYEKIY